MQEQNDLKNRGTFSETWDSISQRVNPDILVARYATAITMARGDLLMRLDQLVRAKEMYGQEIIFLFDKRWACIESQIRLSVIEPIDETPAWIMDYYKQVIGDTDLKKCFT